MIRLSSWNSYRFPDALTKDALTEVKNGARLYKSAQITAYMEYASQTGRVFDLIVRASTVLSGPLEQAINESSWFYLQRLLP